MKKAGEIRSEFLQFFRDRGHTIVKSSSLIPRDDPTLLFTNAGMVQFKRCFLGEEKRPYVRAASSQKCMRAGGKHNDLENVGYTARHHTFFEMLGNFSFGDYFKKEAIEFAWEFLVNYLKLPQDKLYATVHEGDAGMNLGPDDEARELWARYLPEDRILAFPTKDNFWAMGDTGPCGPCSEIIIDQGPEFGCGSADCKPGCDCDRYLELWNLVFMQFDRKPDGTLVPLPRPSIDTGMGLERIAAVVQGVPSNYDIDLFKPIMEKIEELSGHRYGADKTKDVSIKVIADHSRAAAFLVGDGVLPSNEGRGYVLRRVIRRALRHGRFLGLDRPFLHEVALAVMESMKDAYPELIENRRYITEVIKYEEERFNETLDFGLRLLNQEIERLKDTGQSTIPGELVFKLYDTYGFPTDIVTDMARSIGFSVDLEGYESLMKEQRERSRLHWKGSGEAAVEGVYKEIGREVATVEFVGYETLETEGRILAIIAGNKRLNAASRGDRVEIVTDRTSFYGESGGQVGDRGLIEGPKGAVTVVDTKKLPGDLILHVGEVTEGSIEVGESVRLVVDAEARADTARHHTATHLLHATLRKVLGEHVKQSGSLVAPDRLRFDFTHFRALTPEELETVENLVNEEIRKNRSVCITQMSYDEAVRTGAVALFEEKYGDVVRVVEVPGLSKELCGGTHVRATSDIGAFFILNESGIAGGVRRIEAVAGRAAVRWVQNQRRMLRELADILRVPMENVKDRVEKLLEREKQLEKEIERLKYEITAAASRDVLASPEAMGDVRVIVSEADVDDHAAMREVYDRFKERYRDKAVLVLGGRTEDKALLLVGVSRDLTGRIHAGDLIRELASVVGGRGGGRPDMAQAGGPNPEKLGEALEKAREILRRVLTTA
ncbi:alanine--tRNA ligase [Thermodesulforhabdus norvegica]|uniref:Alanine--tRNA ligase n=1 Tax=Thermodesulforhabdus norvegica TaxID=39841 RepID=A0A1I4VKV3_9BACT|nr:alanine--tRNA ligase [Thermodesulforhabdus norvegica]SFN01831.1 alanyl-tRNA synthetase [Thermodesulforhabdus norvegica]